MPQTSATTHIITCPRRIHFRDHSHKSRGECKFPNSPPSEFASATSLLRTVVDFTQRHSPSLSLARRDEIVKAHFNLFAFDTPPQPRLAHTLALSLLIRRLRRPDALASLPSSQPGRCGAARRLHCTVVNFAGGASSTAPSFSTARTIVVAAFRCPSRPSLSSLAH